MFILLNKTLFFELINDFRELFRCYCESISGFIVAVSPDLSAQHYQFHPWSLHVSIVAVSPASFWQPPRFYSGSLTDSIPADSTASSWQSHRLHSGRLPGFPGLTLAVSLLWSGSLPGFILAVSPVLFWESPLVLLWQLPWFYSGSLPGFVLAVSQV